MDDTPSLLWMSPAFAGGGYASEALSFAQGLAARLPSFRMRQFAEQPDESFLNGLPESLLSLLQSGVAEFPNAERHAGAVVCHSPPDAWKPSKFSGWDALSPCPPLGATHVIGRTMYETDSVPAEWVARCNKMDRIWVPTEFHRETFERAGVLADKLAVVGEAVDGIFFNPHTTSPLPLPVLNTDYWAERSGSPFRFLAVFKWELRKGWDALLRAYFAEFGPDEPVELVLKVCTSYLLLATCYLLLAACCFSLPTSYFSLLVSRTCSRRGPSTRRMTLRSGSASLQRRVRIASAGPPSTATAARRCTCSRASCG